MGPYFHTLSPIIIEIETVQCPISCTVFSVSSLFPKTLATLSISLARPVSSSQRERERERENGGERAHRVAVRHVVVDLDSQNSPSGHLQHLRLLRQTPWPSRARHRHSPRLDLTWWHRRHPQLLCRSSQRVRGSGLFFFSIFSYLLVSVWSLRKYRK